MNDNLKVSLTTSGFIVDNFFSSHSHSSQEIFRKLNIPICVAETVMIIPSLVEIDLLRSCILDCSKIVTVDEENRKILIGTTSNLFLVEYTQKTNSQFSSEFFIRWKQTKMLLFEFIIKPDFKSPLWSNFSLKGLWKNEKWDFLDFYKNNSIEIEQLNLEKCFAG